MRSFHLKIIAPDGIRYDGQAQSVTICAVEGYVGILAGHIDFTTALGSGEARIQIDGTMRNADCRDGLLTVQNGEVTLLPAVFNWKN